MKNKEKDDEVWRRFILYCCFKNVYKEIRIFRQRFGEDNVDSNVYEDEFRQFYTKLLDKENGRGFLGTWMDLFKHAYINNKSIFMKYIKLYCEDIFGHDGVKSKIMEYCESDELYFSTPMIFIHFDKIDVVQNENPRIRTTVYDYFVGLSACFGNLCRKDFSNYANQIGLIGAKTTYTKTQMDRCYVHSHNLSSRTVSFTKHCTGDDTPINEHVTRIGAYLRTHTDVPVSYIRIFAELLWSHLTTESLKGLPYNHISNLSIAGSIYCVEHMGLPPIGNQEEQAREMFKLNQKLHLIKFATNGTSVFYANSDDDIAVQMTNLYLLCGYPELENFQGVTRKEGKLCLVDDTTIDESCNPDIKITLCGKEYPLKVIDDENKINIKLMNEDDFGAFYMLFIDMANKVVFEDN